MLDPNDVTPNNPPANAPAPASAAPPNIPAAAPDTAGADQSIEAIAPGSAAGPLPTPKPGTMFPANDSSGNPAVADRHRMIGKIFETIAGGPKTEFAQTPNGPVAVRAHQKPGEMARHILGAAFSLMASGLTGMNDAREHRPVELNPSTTIGGLRRSETDDARRQAQLEFENKNTADSMTLQKNRDAIEQQKSIQDAVLFQEQHQLNQQKIDAGNFNALNDQYALDSKMAADYQNSLNMPGAEVMKGSDGNELNFADTREAQAYANAHPEVLHGRKSDNAMFGTVIRKNPVTGAWQIIDYPSDRHDQVITNFGQKVDVHGEPIFDKAGNPVPDGTVIDPKTKKPTVVTTPITPQQASEIRKNNLATANYTSEIDDRAAQARQRDSEVKKNQALSDAMDIYEAGGLTKMTPRQRLLVAKLYYQDRTIDNQRQLRAQQDYDNLIAKGIPADDPAVVAAKKDLDQAKQEYSDSNEQYNELMGNSAGILFAKRSLFGKNLNQFDWNSFNTQVENSDLTDEEKTAAKNRVWNSLPKQKQVAIMANKGQPSAVNSGPLVKPPAPINVPAGMVAVQIPGQPVGHIPQANLQKFLKDHPNAIQVQQ